VKTKTIVIEASATITFTREVRVDVGLSGKDAVKAANDHLRKIFSIDFLKREVGRGADLDYEVTNAYWSDDSCPGCGCKPGDGYTEGCEEEDGCGTLRKMGNAK